MTPEELEAMRAHLAACHGVERCPAPESEIVGLARDIDSGRLPINGVRCLPEAGTTGWYIWPGDEMSSEADYFRPIHVSHLNEWLPEVLPFLELPPGWRFLVAPGYSDVWMDPEVDLTPLDAAAPPPAR